MIRFSIAFILTAAVVFGRAGAAEDAPKPAAEFKVHPIGYVKKADERTLIVLDKQYQPGLLGLEGFSHVLVFWWFDKNDTPEKRAILQVHPMGNRDNPLTGVFATRSPARPNLIALTLCKVVAVTDNVIQIEKTDAFDGTPVLDIKPFIPGYDTAEDAQIPDWLLQTRKQQPTQADTTTSSRHGSRKPNKRRTALGGPYLLAISARRTSTSRR